MQRSGYVLFALAACLASTQALPTESHSLPEPPSSADQHTSPESNLYPYTQPEQYAEYTQPQSSTDDDSRSVTRLTSFSFSILFIAECRRFRTQQANWRV